MTLLSYHTSNLLLIALETMRLLVLILLMALFSFKGTKLIFGSLLIRIFEYSPNLAYLIEKNWLFSQLMKMDF